MDKYGHIKELKDPGHDIPEDNPEFDDEWLTTDERLKHFRKSREHILGRVKVV